MIRAIFIKDDIRLHFRALNSGRRQWKLRFIIFVHIFLINVNPSRAKALASARSRENELGHAIVPLFQDPSTFEH